MTGSEERARGVVTKKPEAGAGMSVIPNRLETEALISLAPGRAGRRQGLADRVKPIPEVPVSRAGNSMC